FIFYNIFFGLCLTMTELDNILSTIRKENITEEEISDIEYTSEELSTEVNESPKPPIISTIKDEITSSFTNTPKITVKDIEINKLKEIKRNRNNNYSIKNILKESELKINNNLITIVSKILHTTNTITIQLIDENDEINACIPIQLLKEKNIKIGIILEINNFSIWNIKEKEINIVEDNIITIYEEL
ncbi:hypothetical protein SLOPH_1833, partial [Spraguea lophii 42_110]